MHDEEPEDEADEHVQFAMFIIDGECPKCGKVNYISENVRPDPRTFFSNPTSLSPGKREAAEARQADAMEGAV